MKIYRVRDGDTLVISINGGAPKTIIFRKDDFADLSAATAREIVKAMQSLEGVKAEVTGDGAVALTTAARGGHTSVEIDVGASTAAAALGLLSGPTIAHGRGLTAAELVSVAADPHDVPADAELAFSVDGKKHKVVFPKRGRGHAKGWSAAEAAERINDVVAGVASRRRDGRLRLTSCTVGLGSSVRIEPERVGKGKHDASEALGFIGTTRVSEPYIAEPARLVCTGGAPGLEITNLTGSAVELHLASGRLLLPPRGSAALGPRDAASAPLQTLVKRGAVRLSPTRL